MDILITDPQKRMLEESLMLEDANSTLTLYHGSKHLFPKFDMSKINTGQHSQDFGYGLYFTSDKETAEFYANALSNTKTGIQKYNDIVKENGKNNLVYAYLDDDRILSAKRILNNLINTNSGNVNEWKELLDALNVVQRYAYVYTVRIDGGKFIQKHDYVAKKYETGLSDKEMNKMLLSKGYNGIQYRLNTYGLNKEKLITTEFNVVIFDPSIITILDTEKVEYVGRMKIDV